MSDTAPDALRAPLEDYSRSDDFVRTAVADHGTDLLNRPSAKGGWSVLQCFSHLASTNNALADAVEEGLSRLEQGAAASERVRPSVFWRLFLRLVEPPVGFRAKAPAPIQPDSLLEPEKVLADFVAAHDRLRSLAPRCRRVDINRRVFRHPFIPVNISIGSTFLVAAAHDRRHLWQAEQTGHLQ